MKVEATNKKQTNQFHSQVVLKIKSRFIGIEKQGKDSININDIFKTTQNRW